MRSACRIVGGWLAAAALAAAGAAPDSADRSREDQDRPYDRGRIQITKSGPAATSDYERETVAGFKVLVHPEVAGHPKERKDAIEELERQLIKVRSALPPEKFQPLMGVRFWLEWDQKKKAAAEFHVSSQWLLENGHNPDKVHDVEICNVRNFVEWSRTAQPWMVLHELAHAYHHRVLGSFHGGIAAAFRQARERKLYESVPYILGGQPIKGYAITTPDEYFAELSEAYFGLNDYFPFTRADLEKHDPVGYRLMEEVWGATWRGRDPRP